MNKKNDLKNTGYNSSETRICDIIKCYFQNENLKNPFEKEEIITKRFNNCYFCSYAYQNIIEYRKNIKNEIEKLAKIKRNKSCITGIEYVMAVTFISLVTSAIIYFCYKIYFYS